ncbi:MAG: response regulator [Sulfuricella sp.]|nr:response regulator [Sulfuricella sp.]
MIQESAISSVAPPTLLFIDDEANILSSLKRLFRPHGYRILTADSGAAGLAAMDEEQGKVDVVVSDMRMPGMSGAEVLEQIRLKWPDAVRILLTGYADVSSTIAAINRGEIYRYISKPWNDEEILLTVRDSLERKLLKAEKQRLEALTARQNEELKGLNDELKELNASLEDKVRARTEELRLAMEQLSVAHEKLKKGFFTSIQVFANLMEMREKSLTGHSRRVADLSRNLAKKLGLPAAEIQDIVVASLLHDIAKIGLPDRLLSKPFTTLTIEERAEFIKHPAKGAAALMALEQLANAARLIRAHHERFDGLGYPAGLKDQEIPSGARILAVANDYDALQSGVLLPKALNADGALKMITEGRGKRYDPQVVDAFIDLMGKTPKAESYGPEVTVPATKLESGMVLTRDLVSRDGMLLLARDYVLDDSLIGQIRNFEESDGHPVTLYVRPEKLGEKRPPSSA